MMIEIDPKSLVFRDVRLNAAYTTNFTITNPLTVSIDLTLKPSAPRYSVNPSKVSLQPNQSITITVRLFLSNYTNLSRGVRGQEDYISIKSSYFEQKLDVVFYLRENGSRDSVPSRPRSVSPPGRSRRSGGGEDAHGIIMELTDQVKARDIKIKHLEESLGMLEAKYPNMADIIKSRIEQERILFEEKSEKVLKILKKKDETITRLQVELDDSLKNLDALRTIRTHNLEKEHKAEGKSRDYWSGRPLHGHASSGDRESSKYVRFNDSSSSLSALEIELEKVKIDFQNELQLHNATKDNLRRAHDENLSMRVKVQNIEQNISNIASPKADEKVSSNKYQQELRGLREKTLDQADQIEVLVSELSKLRSEASERFANERAIDYAKDEVSALKRDLSHQQLRYTDLQRSHDSLQQNFLIERENYSKAIEKLQNQVKDQEYKDSFDLSDHRSSHQNQSLGQGQGHFSSSQRKYEVNVEGAINTSTPSHYVPVSMTDSHHENRTLKAELYLEQIEKLQHESSGLKRHIDELTRSNNHLKATLSDAQKSNSVYDDDKKAMLEKISRIRQDRDEMQRTLDIKEIEIKSLVEKSNAIQVRDRTQDANVWWSYVWHEVKKMQNMNSHASRESRANDLLVHETSDVLRLKEIIRHQAIELTETRQDMLSKKLNFKKDITSSREQLEISSREIARLNAQIRNHKTDKDIRISELETSIRTLSGRSDLHSQMASVRHELESERLTVHHLRAEIDSYRSMVEAETERSVSLRKEKASLQGIIESIEVLKTITEIPGVDAATLIEVMSANMVQVQSDLSKSKNSVSQYQSQVEALQRSIASKQKSEERSKELNASINENLSSASSSPINAAARGLSRSSLGATPLVSSIRSRSASPGMKSPRRVIFKPSDDLGVNKLPSSTVFSNEAEHTSSSSSQGIAESTKGDYQFANSATSSPFRNAHSTLAVDTDDSFSYNNNLNIVSEGFSINVDGDATPQKVLDSLDAAVLAQRLHLQESTISDLKNRIEELEDEVVRSEQKNIADRDDWEENGRTEFLMCRRKLEVIQSSLDESKAENTRLRGKNLEFENKIIDLESRSHEKSVFGNLIGNNYSHQGGIMSNNRHHYYEYNSTADSTSMAGDNDFDMDPLSVEERKEFENNKNLLKERTSQLKILMETLDAIQSSNYVSSDLDSNDLFNFGGGKGSNPLADLASAPLPSSSVDSSWSSRLLVKRIIELSSDLASQFASSALEERRCEQLEGESKKKTKAINKMKAKLQADDLLLDKMNASIESLSQQLRDSEKFRLNSVSVLKAENETLLATLRESELRINTLEIVVEDLKKNLEFSEKSDHQKWVDALIMDDDNILKQAFADINNSVYEAEVNDGNYDANNNDASSRIGNNRRSKRNSNEDEGSVKGLIIHLLEQFRTHVGPISIAKPKFGEKISKTEKKFLQRVTDLVLGSHERCMKSIQASRWAEMEKREMDLKVHFYSERLKCCMKHLHRYRKRAISSENVLAANREAAMIRNSKLAGMMKRIMYDQKLQIDALMSDLISERRDRRLLECKLSAETLHSAKLNSKITDLESRGNSEIRSRDEAISQYDSKIKIMEDSIQRWMFNELPRVVSGFPISEDYANVKNFDDQFDQFNDNRSSRWSSLGGGAGVGVGGGDKTYALTQALCSAKSIQCVQNLRYNSLTDKYSLLKEKFIRLEGILERQKFITESHGKENGSGMFDGLNKGVTTNSDLDAQIYKSASVENNYRENMNALSNKLFDLEEENIEIKAKLEFATKHVDDMKALSDAILRDEQDLKIRATQQITRIRLELEHNHAIELKQLRESYESENNSLSEEIEKLTVQFIEMKQSLDDQENPAVDHTLKKSSSNKTPLPSSNANRQEFVEDDKKASFTKASSGDHSSEQSDLSRSISAAMNKGVEYSSDNSDELRVEIQDLKRLLELEHRRYVQVKSESEEMGNLLQVQRETFVLQMESSANQFQQNQTSATALPLPASTNFNNEAITSLKDDVSTSSMHASNVSVSGSGYNSDLEQDISKEDHTLWPSINVLSDELHQLLLLIREKSANKAIKSMIFAADSIALRIKKLYANHHLSEMNRAQQSNLNQSNISTSQSQTTVTAHNSGNAPQYASNFERTISASITDTFSTLENRVRLIENDFSSNEVPEKHLFLLRDLRVKMQEIQRNIVDEWNNDKKVWVAERIDLSKKFEEEKLTEIRNIVANKDATIDNLKSHYERTLREEREAFEFQTATANQEIKKVEDLLFKMQSQMQAQMQSKHGDDFTSDVKTLQSVFESTRNDLENANTRIKEVEIQHQKEKLDLEENYRRYRATQENLVRELEFQVEDLRSDSSRLANESKNFSAIQTFPDYLSNAADNQTVDASDQIRKLEFKYKSKSAELEALMKAMGRSVASDRSMSSDSKSSNNTSLSVDHDTFSSNINNNKFDNKDKQEYVTEILQSVPKEYRSEMYEARIVAAESEIESLYTTITNERKANQMLKSQLQSSMDSSKKDSSRQETPSGMKPLSSGNVLGAIDNFVQTFSNDFSLPDESNKDKIRIFVKKVNEFRKYARVEMSRLKEFIVVHEGKELTTPTFLQINAALTEAVASANALKEDNNRKSKLLSSLRSTKSSDTQSLEQRENELRDAEETIKRLNRSIVSKDTIIKDLKAKIQTLEENAEKAAVFESNAIGGGNDVANLQSSDLKIRLRASELERLRQKNRLTALKERIAEVEGECDALRQDNEKLKKVAEKYDTLKLTLHKTEAVAKSYKQENAELKLHCEEAISYSSQLKKEYSKVMTQHSRDIDNKDLVIQELERDCQLMRNRLNKEVEKGGSTYLNTDQKENQRDRMQQESNSNQTLYRRSSSMELPSALVSNASDINDILMSLGGVASSTQPITSRSAGVDESRGKGRKEQPLQSSFINASKNISLDISGDGESGSGTDSSFNKGPISSTEKRLQTLVQTALNK